MVRYPQQNPSEPIKPQVKTVSSEAGKTVKDPTSIKEVAPIKEAKAEQVEELQQRLHTLEEKLNNLEKPAVKAQEPEFIEKEVRSFRAILEYWHRYRSAFFISVLLVFMTWLVVIVVGHIEIASLTLELKPMEFNIQGEEEGISTEGFSGLLKTPGLIEEAVSLALTRVQGSLDGRLIDVKITSFGYRRTKQLAEDWERNFERHYELYRKDFLAKRLIMINKRQSQFQQGLNETFDQMSGYKANEKYFLLNASSKEKLSQLAQKNALEFEQDLINIKDQLSKGSRIRLLRHWSSQNKLMLGMYRLKLTDMEFRKFLVGNDFVSTYEDGMRDVKKLIARLINEQARHEGLDEITASLIIKDLFLSSRLTALESVLNKRYVASVEELSGQRSEYLRLREKFDALNLKLNNAALVASQIRQVLAQGLTREFFVRSPLQVVKL